MMEPWAKRIQLRMAETGHSQADIARACGIKNGSVSGWFGKGTLTKMISGDNLVATAALLETTAEHIMTGRGHRPAAPSQPVGLDAEKLSTVLALVEGAIRDSGKKVPISYRARMVKRVYESQPELTPETANAVQAALAGLLETMGD